MALIVSGLTDYVNVHKDELLVKAAADSKTIRFVDLMPGVKSEDAIPYLSSTVVLDDGSQCGFEAKGDDVFTDRKVKTSAVKVNKEFCWKDFEKKYANYQLNWAAGRETLPFEQKIADANLMAIQKEVEDLVWNGNSAITVDGFIKQISEIDSASTIAVTGLTSASTYAQIIKAVVKAIPGAALKKGVNLFLSHTAFNAYIAEQNESCCANRPIQDANVDTLVYAGDSRITLIPVEGLEDSGAYVAASKDALVYATDIEGSEGEYKMWYSEDNDKFRLRVLFRAGTALRWPDEIAYYIPA